MIINSSAVKMSAQTNRRVNYKQNNETLMMNLNTGMGNYNQNTFQMGYETKMESEAFATFDRTSAKLCDNTEVTPINGAVLKESQDDEIPVAGQPESGFENEKVSYPVELGNSKLISLRQKDSTMNLLAQLRLFLYNFRNSLSLMIGRRYAVGTGDVSKMSDTLKGYSSNVIDLSSGTFKDKSVWNRINYSSYTYEESESMDFETVGSVVTADGRTLDFNMQVSMSREYVETVEELTSDTMVIMTDPLVISLDSNPVSVSDQKWKFDIDGDGKKDNISLLSKGQGFLVYDKNEDGIINDGLEMFGAATGNGFKELSAYDEDGNGWIDENDSIYNKLSVWLKDDDGNDRMVGLKQANVGAIYLGSMATDYALKTDSDYNAQLRRSGMYLTEDGTSRSISQLDMVKALVS